MGTINYISKPAREGAFVHGRRGAIQSIILHSSCGHESGDIPTLRGEDPTHIVSVHWYVDKIGKIFHFVDNVNTAWHVGAATEVRYSNSCSIGIEQEHLDQTDEPWPDIQVQTTAKLCFALAERYGPLSIAHHSQVAFPAGRKTDPVNFPSDVFWQAWSEASQDTWDFAEVAA